MLRAAVYEVTCTRLMAVEVVELISRFHASYPELEVCSTENDQALPSVCFKKYG